MAYFIKEIYFTLQGEGSHTGRPAIFCRFAGCNLWTGREQDREKAICQFCDTDFIGTDGPGGGTFASADELAERLHSYWPTGNEATPYIVCTGGEPLLQIDAAFIKAIHERSMIMAIETNGTKLPPAGIDWVCVSPKAGSDFKLTQGDELKLVYPQPEAMPERFAGLDFEHFYLQPMDGPNTKENTAAAVQYCLKHPQWKLSLQTHKFLGID
ncbi:7-carboxy-7-deazaguanine synthase [Polystyrenella longa]|uniref:7-carboxy-7-deazaguanine synthase n=1 Tax=Polystyrenella longa TaxID=2528007 RepID=A0A518CSC6_9PLAN|nr:7-carboxy-7-deazaguanine synthase [Polystyrenella longa]QDU82116.1 7-carboxy-7-deazaguanine synthase [Polystyrenella longa]